MALSRLEAYTLRGMNGAAEDVDFLMAELMKDNTFATVKLVDYALDLIENEEGISRLECYLFESKHQKQRNYAALYFSRRLETELLYRAIDLGLIDYIQAFSK